MWLPSFSAIMIALAVHDMFWRLWGMFATDVEQFLWGSKLVSALMIVLFYFCFCSLSCRIRSIRSESQVFVLQPSLEHSPYHLVGVWRGDPAQIAQERGLLWWEGEVLWILLNLFILSMTCQLPLSLTLWMDVSYIFFLFPGNLKLEVLSSEAVGLQAVYVMYDYFSQTIFILKRFHLAGPQFRHHM